MSFRDTQHLNTARGWSVYQDPVSSNEPAMIEPNNHNILQKGFAPLYVLLSSCLRTIIL